MNEKEKMLVKFRQELALKQQEADSLRRLFQDMTAISTAQEISSLQNDEVKSVSSFSDKYSNSSLPRIISACRENELKNDTKINIGAANKVRLSVSMSNTVRVFLGTTYIM